MSPKPKSFRERGGASEVWIVTQAGSTLADRQGDLTPLQRQVLVQGWLEIKKQEMEAQSKMMGGGSSSPTSSSTRNGRSGSSPNTRVEEKSYVNPNAGDPTDNTD